MIVSEPDPPRITSTYSRRLTADSGLVIPNIIDAVLAQVTVCTSVRS